jgi:Na+/H+ antiporter NhaD/arsenite permease-like protein
MNIELIDKLAGLFFAAAILHTFLTKKIHHYANAIQKKGMIKGLLLVLSEVELVFIIWSLMLFILSLFFWGSNRTLLKMSHLNFTESFFVMFIMIIASTRPITLLARNFILRVTKYFPLNKKLAYFFGVLMIGPLLGSFITEPAAMTVTAILLLEAIFQKPISLNLKYSIIALLFVNIAIGGSLTPFAAPPIIMVAQKWEWTLSFMFKHFALKTLISLFLSTLFISLKYKKEIIQQISIQTNNSKKIPLSITFINLFILIMMIVNAHSFKIFSFTFICFLIFYKMSKRHQGQLKLKEGVLVCLFLLGLTILGSYQEFWITPLIKNLRGGILFSGSMILTSIVDNAAITYLGSLVTDLDESQKLALVYGSLIGGGLTIIANAPNPIGHKILEGSFNEDGLSATLLFKAALIPTLITAIVFYFFPY